MTDAARAGNAIAQQILTCAGEELGLLATIVIKRLQFCGEFDVALVGGVFQTGDLIDEPLRRRVHASAPAARVIPLVHPPVLGAVFMAWQMLELPLDSERMERAHACWRESKKS